MHAAQAGSRSPTLTLFDAVIAALVLGLSVVIVSLALRPADSTPDLALSTLRRDPLDLVALRNVGLRLERAGQTRQSDAIFDFLSHRTWRDGPATVWLLRRYLSESRYDEAFQRADSLLRRDGERATWPSLFPMLIQAAAFDEARPALIARVRDPRSGWRSDLLWSLAEHGDPNGALKVFSALAAGSTPPTSNEYPPLVNRLVTAGAYPVALQVWTQIVRPRDPHALIRDGDFTGAYDHTAFSWSAAEGVGATSEVESAPEEQGARVLRVDYDGFSTPSLPNQLLVLPAGTWRLTWRESVQPATDSLGWRVRCAETGQVLVKSQTAGAGPIDAFGWRSMSMDFATPDTGCTAQWLELIANPGDRRDPVRARYGRFRIGPR